MKTIKTIHDLLDVTASNYLCAIEGTTNRVIEAYLPNELYKNLDDVENDIMDALGECYDNLDEIESGKINDVDGLLYEICEAHIKLLEAYQKAIRCANGKA